MFQSRDDRVTFVLGCVVRTIPDLGRDIRVTAHLGRQVLRLDETEARVDGGPLGRFMKRVSDPMDVSMKRGTLCSAGLSAAHLSNVESPTLLSEAALVRLRTNSA